MFVSDKKKGILNIYYFVLFKQIFLEQNFLQCQKVGFSVSTDDFTWFVTATWLIRKTHLSEIDRFVGLQRMNA